MYKSLSAASAALDTPNGQHNHAVKGDRMSRTVRVETWRVRDQGRDSRGRFAAGRGGGRRRARVVVRNSDGTFDGATNFRQSSRVGQVGSARR